MSESRLVDVAVAVLEKPDGAFLLAKRPEGKPYAGYWEFPGGKVESGESVYDALVREIHEELGVSIERAYPWITQVFDYPHAKVRLHFYRVNKWKGEPYPHENQAFSWQESGKVHVSPLLPANGPVLKSLALPVLYGISNAAEMGRDVFLQQLEAACAKGPRIIQIREKQMQQDELTAFIYEVLAISRRYGAKTIINGNVELAQLTGADGVNLNAQQLHTATARPDVSLVGASCHSRDELLMAEALGLDYALLSPVLPTLTHPEAQALGWQSFSEMITGISLPVYALGGMQRDALTSAMQNGAHGIAMMRGAWADEA